MNWKKSCLVKNKLWEIKIILLLLILFCNLFIVSFIKIVKFKNLKFIISNSQLDYVVS